MILFFYHDNYSMSVCARAVCVFGVFPENGCLLYATQFGFQFVSGNTAILR